MSDWETKRDRLKAIIDSKTEFELKGKSVPYTSANGHMFSQLNKDGELGVRLSEDDRAWFDDEWGAEDFLSYGSVMNGYVRVPDELLDDGDTIADLFNRGHRYVLTLDPK